MVAALLLVAGAASLQALAQSQASVAPGARFAWEQSGPGLEVIRSYRYEVEIDGQRQKDLLTDVQCTRSEPPATQPFECTAPVPIPLGQHVIRVRAVDTTVAGADAVESAWSPGFFYVMRPTPGAPSKMRVVKPKGPPQ